MSSIRYQSFSPAKEVHFSARTEDKEPSVWTVADAPGAHDAYKEDLYKPGGGTPLLVRTVRAEGLAADVVADMWARYTALRSAVAETQNPVERWTAWATGKLAVRGAIEATAPTQRKWLLTDLASQETVLRQQYGANNAHLHPVSLAMRNFMYGQEQLGGLNGSTPNRELLPAATFADPIEIMGMIALDLAEMPAPEPVEVG